MEIPQYTDDSGIPRAIPFFAGSFAKHDWPESPHCPAMKSCGGSDQRELPGTWEHLLYS